MKKKDEVLPTEDALSLDLTLHDFSATLLTEFARKVVKPYYSGNLNEAFKDLIQKVIRDEQSVLDHVKPING